MRGGGDPIPTKGQALYVLYVYYNPCTVPEVPAGGEDGIVHEAAQDETQHKV